VDNRCGLKKPFEGISAMASEDRLETTTKTASNIRTLLGVAAGLVIGAFVTGFTLKQQYEDIMKAYNTVQALQQNK
jgi:hypothetical protein